MQKFSLLPAMDKENTGAEKDLYSILADFKGFEPIMKKIIITKHDTVEGIGELVCEKDVYKQEDLHKFVQRKNSDVIAEVVLSEDAPEEIDSEWDGKTEIFNSLDT